MARDLRVRRQLTRCDPRAQVSDAAWGLSGELLSGWPAVAFVGSVEMALGWLIAGFRHVTRPQREAHKRWMASLTPQQRAAVYAAQAAGMILAHQAMRHSNERARERREGQAARQRYVKAVMSHAQGLDRPRDRRLRACPFSSEADPGRAARAGVPGTGSQSAGRRWMW